MTQHIFRELIESFLLLYDDFNLLLSRDCSREDFVEASSFNLRDIIALVLMLLAICSVDFFSKEDFQVFKVKYNGLLQSFKSLGENSTER